MSARGITRRAGLGGTLNLIGRDHTGSVAFEFSIEPHRWTDQVRPMLEQLLDLVDPPAPALTIEPGTAPRVSRSSRDQESAPARAASPLRVVR